MFFISSLRTSSSKSSLENNESQSLQKIDNTEELNKSFTREFMAVAKQLKPDNTMIDEEVREILQRIIRLIEKRFEKDDENQLNGRLKEIEVSFPMYFFSLHLTEMMACGIFKVLQDGASAMLR